MFNPNKLIIEEINFENKNEVYQFIALLHAHYSSKPLNMVMQEKLINGVYEKRLSPQINFKLLMESYISWMSVEDQPTKHVFAYLFGIFKKKKDAYLQDGFQKDKEKNKVSAAAYRALQATKDREETKAETTRLYKLLKQHRSKFNDDNFMLINSLIKTDKLLRAGVEIDKIINKG